MKRRGWLIAKIADMDNLRLAFWKAKKGKSAAKEVIAFTRPSLDENLLILQKGIIYGNIDLGGYHYFKVYDPKERLICAAPFAQRVLHHAIMNVCHYDFDRVQIYDSYASRIGKGTHAAIERAEYFTNKYRYCLKLDIRKYFDNINHTILKNQLHRLFKDPYLLNLMSQIIDSYRNKPGYGLPIGNLTSQYFANHYLCVLDHYVKENLKAEGYVRYMDDIMVWSNDRMHLKHIGVEIKRFIDNNLGLCLKMMSLSPTSTFTTFLGYRLSSHGIGLSRRSSERYIRRIQELALLYNNGFIDQDGVRMKVSAMLSFIEKVPCDNVKRRAMKRFI